MNATLKEALTQVDKTREMLHQMRQPGGIVVTVNDWRDWGALATDLINLRNEAKECADDIEAVRVRAVSVGK